MNYIIDPISPEENRGSFCFLCYYLYAAFVEMDVDDVTLIENCCFVRDRDKLARIKSSDYVLVALWSHTQIEFCHLILGKFPQAQFFGYIPLIEAQGLPQYEIEKHVLHRGMRSYTQYLLDFEHIGACDSDGHIEGRPEVVHVCTKYGCSRNCSFCPVTPALQMGVTALTVAQAVRSIDNAMAHDLQAGVHFVDEDFLQNVQRAKGILEGSSKLTYPPTGYIVLSSVTSVTAFLASFETDEEAFAFCEKHGLYLIEIGLETASPSLSTQLGKPSFDWYEELAERCKDAPFDILWLTMSLVPGETLGSIRATGKFLEKWGLPPERLCPRIRTNGTVGGLGQFFQLYEGTRGYEKAVQCGAELSAHPCRLFPSYVPYSLLDDKIGKARAWTEGEIRWLDVYSDTILMKPGMTVRDIVAPDLEEEDVPVHHLVKRLYAVLVAARLGIIEGEYA